MKRIPDKDKRFVVDNSSFSRGNVYSTFNVMFDKDIGKVSLNPPLIKLYSSADDADFTAPYAMLVAPADYSTYGDIANLYILTDDANGFGGVWKTLGGLAKLTGTGAPSKATNATSDMKLFLGAQTSPKLYVSDADGLHWCKPTESMDNWGTLLTTAGYKNNFILIPFTEQNRLYMVQSSGDKVYSVTETSDATYDLTTSGSYTLVGGLSGITCGAASSKRIWLGASNQQSSDKSKIYEWDGVKPNPLNIFTIDTKLIQTIVIINDLPVAIDGRGRFWFYDGYQFVLKPGINIPAREDDVNQTVSIHRNGAMAEKGKIYVAVSSIGSAYPNTSERALAGVWCYDPLIGLYHWSSPDNNSRLAFVYAISRWTVEQSLAVGCFGNTANISGGSTARVCVTDTSVGLSGGLRTGFITTQFIESANLTDLWNAIGIKYRKMIDPDAVIEIKYRTWKNIDCNTTATWTGVRTFTCTTTDLLGTTNGTYNTPVAVGDEIFVQYGNNSGLIAHVVSMVDNAGTTTVTIDRDVSVTSGTSYVQISNYKLLKTITNDGDSFKNVRLGVTSTMIQVKVVMWWKGYYDEVQEILLPEQAQDKTV